MNVFVEHDLCFWCLEAGSRNCCIHDNHGVCFDDVAVRPYFNDDLFETVEEYELINVETHVKYQKGSFSFLSTCSQFKAPDKFRFKSSNHISVLRGPKGSYDIGTKKMEKELKSDGKMTNLFEEKRENKVAKVSKMESAKVIRIKDVELKLKEYVCSICKKSFPLLNKARFHLVKYHEQLLPDIPGKRSTKEKTGEMCSIKKNKKTSKIPNMVPTEELTPNVIVGEQAASSSFYELSPDQLPNSRHVSIIEEVIPQLDLNEGLNVELTADQGSSHQELQQVDGQYNCQTCGKSEHSPFQLSDHMAMVHSDTSNWKCGYCGKEFGSRGSLRRHIQLVHINLLYKCSFLDCTYPGFKSTKALNTHVRTVHLNVRLVCNVCDRTFAQQCNLKRHLLRHSENRQLKAPFCRCTCGQDFHRLFSLVRHQKNCETFLYASEKELMKHNKTSEFVFE